ncbi:hypothetical protein FZC68_10485 [Bacillus pumilus]|uniref:Uncharacterized protein n=1 Tax=Bacillus pumilus TaxID=1408 RepID=A0AAD2JDV5_BACPU|nr:hypothetical protein C5695_10595 [Bacillus pumilus]TYS42883.1 hypothetical protein FZC68_10485 [Bacillus pumilus]
MMPLKRVPVEKAEDGIEISRLPNNEEIIDKVNEIVRFVNTLEKKKADKPINNSFLKTRKW